MKLILYFREIIVYSRSTINAYSFLSHEWWTPLIKFIVELTIHVRGGLRIYGTPKIPNNFPFFFERKVYKYIAKMEYRLQMYKTRNPCWLSTQLYVAKPSMQ